MIGSSILSVPSGRPFRDARSRPFLFLTRNKTLHKPARQVHIPSSFPIIHRIEHVFAYASSESWMRAS
jgi:hypothetical protein